MKKWEVKASVFITVEADTESRAAAIAEYVLVNAGKDNVGEDIEGVLSVGWDDTLDVMEVGEDIEGVLSVGWDDTLDVMEVEGDDV